MKFYPPVLNEEERRDLLIRAKRGDERATSILWERYSLRTWTQEELDALNLLIDNDVRNEVTEPYLKALEKARKLRLKKRSGELGRTEWLLLVAILYIGLGIIWYVFIKH